MAVSVLCCLVAFFFSSVSWTIGACEPSKQLDSQHSLSLVEQIIKQIDTSVKPCERINYLACGKFINETVVPDDRASLKSYYLIQNQIQENMKWSLEEESPPDELHAVKLLKKFYRACMNEAAIEAKGLNPLRDFLKSLGTWPVLEGDNWIEEDFSWTEAIYKMNAAGIADNFFLPLDVAIIRFNNTKKLRLKLSTPDIPTKIDHTFMVRVAVLLGADETQVKKELQEAPYFGSALSDDNSTIIDPKFSMTVAELIKTTPSIPWNEYFQRMLPANITIDETEEILLEDYNYIYRFEKAISETTKRTQANYLMYRIFMYFAPFLNAEMRLIYLESQNLLSDMEYKSREPSERWIQCLDIVPQHMYASLARLYVSKHFANELKQRAIEITVNIKRQFRSYLMNLSWMDDESKKIAVDKLDAMKSHIGYSEEILDDAKIAEFYTGLIIDKNDFFNSFLNVIRSKKELLLNIFRAADNENLIFFDELKSSYFDAHYIRSENKIYVPFGAIQVALGTNSSSPQYMNYGRLGFMIAHEIAHGFDDTGKYYDENGHRLMKHWWTTLTEQRYQKELEKLGYVVWQKSPRSFGIRRSDCWNTGTKVRQSKPKYDLIPENSATLDRKLAYYFGLKVAYKSYEHLDRRNELDSELPGLPYSPIQLYWISVAHSMCEAYQNDLRIQHPNSYVKSPEFLKVLLELSEFLNDFECYP